MDIFKNKYYKVFSLSIFITQCADKTVKFKYEDQLNICKTYIKFDKKNNILEEIDEILYQNGTDYTVNKYFNKNKDIITDDLYDSEGNKHSKNDIIQFLNSYKYYGNIVYEKKNRKKKIDGYELGKKGFDKNLYFYLYFYKKLDKKIRLLNTFNQELDIDQAKITTENIINKIEDINKIDSYREKIYEIIKIFYPTIKSSRDKIKSINDEKINKKTENNKKIFEDFIEELDKDDNVINIVLDDYYDPKITNILLSKDLEKIYKITEDKKKDIKDKLNIYYENYKYSSLQAELDEKNVNVIIDNGNTDNDIENLDDVTITITEDKGKGENKVIVPKQCTIKFKAGNNLFITDTTNYPATKSINFSEDEGGITTDTRINDYINTKYFAIKNNCIITPQGDNGGKFEDGTVVTVTINNEINGITSKKDQSKVYVNVKFKVSDDSKFRFKGSLVKTNEFDLVLEKNKKISNLLTEIVTKLGNKNLKDGYKIEKDNNIINDNETKLVDNAKYIITLANDDSNFVEKIEDKPEDKDKAKKDSLINECEKLLSDIKNLDSSYNEPINEDDSVENLESLKDKLTSKLKALKNKKPENNNNNNNTNKTKYCGKEKGKKTKKSGKGCC